MFGKKNHNQKHMIISKLVDIFKTVIKDEEIKPNWKPVENGKTPVGAKNINQQKLPRV